MDKRGMITIGLGLLFGLYCGYLGLSFWQTFVLAAISGAAIVNESR